jgi:hypothetical protein
MLDLTVPEHKNARISREGAGIEAHRTLDRGSCLARYGAGWLGSARLEGRNLDGRRLTFDVGVTGHRVVRLAPVLVSALPQVIDEVMTALRDGVLGLHAMSGALAAAPVPELWVDSALATGADQLVAASARRLGYKVRALLPFSAVLYREDFAAGAERSEFDRQLAQSDAVLAQSSPRDGSDIGYITVGKAIIAAADVLVAVWDGDDTENAPGGTAHVVALAAEAGVPVIHIVVDRTAGRIGPVVLRTATGSSSLGDGGDYDALLRLVLSRHRRRG